MQKEFVEPVDQLVDELFQTVFVNNILNDKDIEERNLLVEKLQHFLLNFWPDIKLELYGSMRSGLALKTSDIDLALTFSDNPGTPDEDEIAENVRLVAQRLKCMPGIQVNTILDTNRVPLIKLSETKTKLDVDICLHKSQSVIISQMLKVYCAIDERALVLGCMLKKLTKELDIATTIGFHFSIVGHYLSQYAYVLAMVYFLQRTSPPVLPVLSELGYDGDVDVDWAAKIRSEWSGYRQNEKSVGNLWLEFLDYYTEGLMTEKFDAEELVVSISQSSPLSKAEVYWDYSSGIAIQDPGDLESNIGAIPLLNYLKMKTVFVQAKNVLEEAMEEGRRYLLENYFEWIARSVHNGFSKPNYERSRLEIPGAVSNSVEFKKRVRSFANCGHPTELCEENKCRWGGKLSKNGGNWKEYKQLSALPSAFKGKHSVEEAKTGKAVKNDLRKKHCKLNPWSEVMPTLFNDSYSPELSKPVDKYLRNNRNDSVAESKNYKTVKNDLRKKHSRPKNLKEVKPAVNFSDTDWTELSRRVEKDLRNNNLAAVNYEDSVNHTTKNWREYKEVLNLNQNLNKCDINGKGSAKTWRQFKEVDLKAKKKVNIYPKEFENLNNFKASEQSARSKPSSPVNKPITRASLEKDNFDKLLKENKIYYC